MSIKSDRWISKMSREHGMIEPFEDKQVREGAISYGVSSYGYDIRIADEFMIFTNVNSTIVDPKNFDERSLVKVKADTCIIPPNSFALAKTVEYFRIPRSVLTVCVGKSTYARCGIIVNVTPFEPEWEGFVTLEVSNTTPCPPRYMRTRASRRSCSSRATRSARPPTPTRRASTRNNRASPWRSCRGQSRPDDGAIDETDDGAIALCDVMQPPPSSVGVDLNLISLRY